MLIITLIAGTIMVGIGFRVAPRLLERYLIARSHWRARRINALIQRATTGDRVAFAALQRSGGPFVQNLLQLNKLQQEEDDTHVAALNVVHELLKETARNTGPIDMVTHSF